MNTNDQLPELTDIIIAIFGKDIKGKERILLENLYEEIKNAYQFDGIEGIEFIKNEVKEWENEPDELGFTDKTTGLECWIWRNPGSGFLCGYVIIPKEHKLYEKNLFGNSDFEVHGGISFSDFIRNEFMIGFDCGHAGDLSPYTYISSTPYDTYRNIEYVKAECISLAKQISEYKTEEI